MSQTTPEKERPKGRESWPRQGWLILAGVMIALLAASLYWDTTVQGNFGVVVPGKLYRSAQPDARQLEEWIRGYGLKSILDLRHSVPPYEQELARRYGIHIFRVPFSAETGLTEEQWQEIRSILTRKQNLPLLYHCRAGADRTGIVTARYRIEVQGWPIEEALREMERHYHFPARYPILQKQLKDLYGGKPQPADASAATR